MGILGSFKLGTRYCYLDGSYIASLFDGRDGAEQLATDLLDALLEQLEAPGKTATLRGLANREKLKIVARQIEHFRQTETSLWYQVPATEVLAASLYRVFVDSKRMAKVVYHPVKKEADLLKPVENWLFESELDTYCEVPLGTKRVDVLGYREAGFLRGSRAVGVELKNDLEQLKRGLDQLATFKDYANAVYLACTPALAASYLDRHAEARNVRHWDPDLLTRKLKAVGVGLLLVEGTHVTEVLKPVEAAPTEAKARELLGALREFAD